VRTEVADTLIPNLRAKQKIGRRRQHHPVGEGVPRASDLSAQDGQLVWKHGEFHILGVRCRSQPDQPEDVPDDLVVFAPDVAVR
jgi:hypothetical protein